MWRTNAFTENEDSDQSLSEEENLDGDWTQNSVSLGGPLEKKGIQVLSQLETLRDTYELDCATKATISPQKRQKGFSIEDDVEIPAFDNEGGTTCSPGMASRWNLREEILSDNEKDSLPKHGSAKNKGVDTWFVATGAAEAPVHLNNAAGCSSSHAIVPKANRCYKGAQGRTKPKFSFRFQSHKSDHSWAVNSEDEPNMPKVLSFLGESEFIEYRNMESSGAECEEVSHEEEIEQSEIHALPAVVALGNNYTEHSMTELLDSLQEKNGFLRGNSKTCNRAEGKRIQLAVKRSIYPWNDRAIHDDEIPKALDSAPCSDDEDFPQELKLINLESRGRTIADQFQEALDAALINDEGPHFALSRQSDAGLFGKLQHLMQIEKEQDKGFLKSIQTEAVAHDEANFMDVRILLKCLEAKMTVCSCFFIVGGESSYWVDIPEMEKKIGETTLKIIFSSRICSDVELEVGNLIRIHAPWKEVHVREKDEIIILSTYFSQISN